MISTAEHAHDRTVEAAMQTIRECHDSSGRSGKSLRLPACRAVSPTRSYRRAVTPPIASGEGAPSVRNSAVPRKPTPRVHSLPDSESHASKGSQPAAAVALDSRHRWMRNSSVSSSGSASSSESIALCSSDGPKSSSCPPSRSSTPNKRQETRLPPCLPAVAMEVGAVLAHGGRSSKSPIFPSSASESQVSLFHESASVSSASTFSSPHSSPANSRSSSMGRLECDWSASHCPCLGEAVLASGRLRRTQAAATTATPHNGQTGAILRLHGRKFREVSVSAAPLRVVVVGAQLSGKVQPGQVIFVVPVGLHECIDEELTVVAVERGNREVAALAKEKAGQCCTEAKGKEDVSPRQQPVGTEGSITGYLEGRGPRAPIPRKNVCRQRQCVEMMVTAFLSKGGKEGVVAGGGTGAVAAGQHLCRVSVSNTWCYVREGRMRWSKLFTVSTPPPAEQPAATRIAELPLVTLPQPAVC